jgi:hypothetical protein
MSVTSGSGALTMVTPGSKVTFRHWSPKACAIGRVIAALIRDHHAGNLSD